MAQEAQEALAKAQEIELELRLSEQRTEQIFRQIEEAMTVSIKPLNKMFTSAGMNPDSLIGRSGKVMQAMADQ